MSIIEISEEEKEWLKANYETLEIQQEIPLKLSGILQFDMFYDEEQYIINPDRECHPEKNRIIDSYQIEIVFENNELSALPKVREVEGRIKKAAERSEDPENLHVNPNETVCLCFRLEEEQRLPNGFNVRDFFYNLVIPFFYAQSYFEKFGIWPWGQYSHGIPALFEWYEDNKDRTDADLIQRCVELLKKDKNWSKYERLLRSKGKIKGHWECVFCSSSRFRDCHPKAFRGMWQLKNDMRVLSVKI